MLLLQMSLQRQIKLFVAPAYPSVVQTVATLDTEGPAFRHLDQEA